MVVLMLVAFSMDAAAQEQDSSVPLKVTVGAFAVAQTVDTNLTTWLLAKSGDRYREANPLLRPIAHQPVSLAIVKAGSAVGVSYVLLKLGRSERKQTRVAALLMGIGLTAATSYVSYRNYQHYQREIAR